MSASLEAVLAWREDVAASQAALRSRYQCTVLSFSLITPGKEKVSPLIRRCFNAGVGLVRKSLEAEKITILGEELKEGSGEAGYAFFAALKTEAEVVKKIGVTLEETQGLGRLFDIDVFDSRGNKKNRTGMRRKCLLCGNNAFLCARSRAHPVSEVAAAAEKLMLDFLREEAAERVTRASVWALAAEVAVTPKSGLVDRGNCGAHRDMNFFTFLASLSEITPFFAFCARSGFTRAGDDAARVLADLRLSGKITEGLMRKVTGGVNTHQGAIFSLGLLSAAFGRLYRCAEMVSMEALAEECGAFFTAPSVEAPIGEAENEARRGFPTARSIGLPVLRDCLDAGWSVNDAGAASFLRMLAVSRDSNIVKRGGEGALERIHRDLSIFFTPFPGRSAILQKAATLDEEFITSHLSPGGTADLLAVTFFLHTLFPR